MIVVQDRAEAAVLGEQRVAAAIEQVQVERLVGLLLAVALDCDVDGNAAEPQLWTAALFRRFGFFLDCGAFPPLYFFLLDCGAIPPL